MNLIKCGHEEDFGQGYTLQLLFNESWALLQTSVSWCVFASGPFLQITCGHCCLFSVIFQVYKFGFSLGLIDRTWTKSEYTTIEEESKT